VEEEGKDYPLVLLHVSLLPIDLPWSGESMRERLPAQTLENLQMLRSKVSETMLQRGVLIRHPQADFELLEERILEVLELRDPRVTKCGHFLRRDSYKSQIPESTQDRDSDSGLGSGVDESDGEVCETCHCHIQTTKASVGDKEKKWTIKIFAANGLMRSSAWGAAWPEMERIDCEILPWIGDDVRQKLDQQLAQEAAESRLAESSTSVAITRAQQAIIVRENDTSRQQEALKSVPAASLLPSSSTSQPTAPSPQVHKPSQIPLSVLLKNYIYLLAQDRRNVVILFLVLLLALMAAGQPRDRQGSEVVPIVENHCSPCDYLVGPLEAHTQPEMRLTEVEAEMDHTSLMTPPGDVTEVFAEVDENK
jgi:hypothetical protein